MTKACKMFFIFKSLNTDIKAVPWSLKNLNCDKSTLRTF